jgi:hypothetical protein
MTWQARVDAAADDLRDQVLAQLDKRGLLPSPDDFERTLRRVIRRGERCRREFLLPIVGQSAWRQVGRRLECSDSRLAAILGFGEAMTEFFVAGIPMSARSRSRVIRIGALSKFILSIYDKLVDSLGERDLLPRSALLQAVSGEQPVRTRRMPTDAPRKVVARAVSAYFENLQKLPFAAQRAQERQLLGAGIVKLFDVEISLRPDTRRLTVVREKAVFEKAAFSFVSMGLPAWLASPQAVPAKVSRHYKWLCDLGEFLGWVDDVADIEEDLRAGFPNRATMRLRKRNGLSAPAVGLLADEITRLGSRVMTQWSHRVPSADAHGECLDYFRTNVYSWLGGPRYLSFDF